MISEFYMPANVEISQYLQRGDFHDQPEGADQICAKAVEECAKAYTKFSNTNIKDIKPLKTRLENYIRRNKRSDKSLMFLDYERRIYEKICHIIVNTEIANKTNDIFTTVFQHNRLLLNNLSDSVYRFYIIYYKKWQEDLKSAPKRFAEDHYPDVIKYSEDSDVSIAALALFVRLIYENNTAKITQETEYHLINQDVVNLSKIVSLGMAKDIDYLCPLISMVFKYYAYQDGFVPYLGVGGLSQNAVAELAWEEFVKLQEWVRTNEHYYKEIVQYLDSKQPKITIQLPTPQPETQRKVEKAVKNAQSSAKKHAKTGKIKSLTHIKAKMSAALEVKEADDAASSSSSLGNEEIPVPPPSLTYEEKFFLEVYAAPILHSAPRIQRWETVDPENPGLTMDDFEDKGEYKYRLLSQDKKKEQLGFHLVSKFVDKLMNSEVFSNAFIFSSQGKDKGFGCYAIYNEVGQDPKFGVVRYGMSRYNPSLCIHRKFDELSITSTLGESRKDIVAVQSELYDGFYEDTVLISTKKWEEEVSIEPETKDVLIKMSYRRGETLVPHFSWRILRIKNTD